jgi:hypothetical protein
MVERDSVGTERGWMEVIHYTRLFHYSSHNEALLAASLLLANRQLNPRRSRKHNLHGQACQGV